MEEQKVVDINEVKDNEEEVKENAEEVSEQETEAVYPKNKLEEFAMKHPKAAVIGGWVLGSVTTGLLGFGAYKLFGKAAAKAASKAVKDTTAKVVEEAPKLIEANPDVTPVVEEAAKAVVETVAEK